MNQVGSWRDLATLQFVVLLWGGTAVLGDLIPLEAVPLVTARTFLAALVLGLLLRSRLVVPRRLAGQFFATGLIIGVHWIGFFLAVKLANVSVCMVGLSTLSLWTALLEPLFFREKSWSLRDLVFSIVIGGAVAGIFFGQGQYTAGFLAALVSAITGALFSIFNKFHVPRAHHQVITFYEMAGAFSLALLALSFWPNGWSDFAKIFAFQPFDWLWLLLLAIGCTVVAFSIYVELLNRLSVFTINFSNNLEPVYGITLAALFLGDHTFLQPRFFICGLIILVGVALYPYTARRPKELSVEQGQR